MDFVNDEHARAVARREIAHRFAQLADFVNAAVRGSVNLQDVHGIPGGDFRARSALAAGPDRWALGAIERLGEDPRRGGLPHAARARENVTVRHPVPPDGVGECFRDQLLTDHLVENLRPVLAGDHLVGHGILDFRFWILDR